MNKENNSVIEKVNQLIKNSVTLKLLTICILMLLLLIPASMIMSIIQERKRLNEQAVAEVSAMWADQQRINGPVLTIPLLYEYREEDEIIQETRYWHLLPKNLKASGEVQPEELERGIYDVVVYQTSLSFSGKFSIGAIPDPVNLKETLYQQSFLTIGITDLRGIKDTVTLRWGQNQLPVKPGSKIPDIIDSGITIEIPDLANKLGTEITFDFSLDLNGSRKLSFTPIGELTEIRLNSTWAAPSFGGNFLPDDRKVDEEGFKAVWKILQLNRNFPQSWIGSKYGGKMEQSAFGVELIPGVDDYQKSYRSAKYAAMSISLTFLVFFLVEILNRRKIHPFQYILVGLALCLFFVLLVSLSEHMDFNLAYGLATLGVVTMIGLYSTSIFKEAKLTYLLTLILTGIYGFLFVTLQLEAYALLLGSLGLGLILAATMYFTRNINWYRLNIEPR